MNTADTFWENVTPTGFCWEWTGYLTHEGYGLYWLDGDTRGVHRIAYELLVGPIGDGLQIDHLCRTRNCVNPDHMEPITPAQQARGMACAYDAFCGQPSHHEVTRRRVALPERRAA